MPGIYVLCVALSGYEYIKCGMYVHQGASDINRGQLRSLMSGAHGYDSVKGYDTHECVHISIALRASRSLIAIEDRHKHRNMDRLLIHVSIWRLPLVASQAET